MKEEKSVLSMLKGRKGRRQTHLLRFLRHAHIRLTQRVTSENKSSNLDGLLGVLRTPI
jgi:hypothetical protein